MEDSSCASCPEGEYEAGTVKQALKKGYTVLVVKHVPALVCNTCGDTVVSEKVSDRLEEMINEAVAIGVEWQVRAYEPPPSNS